MMVRRSGPLLLLALTALLSPPWTPAASAAVRLPAVIGDGMVLQRGRPVPVWGWTEPGGRVTVRIAGQARTSDPAGESGRWEIRLDPMEAGGPYTMTVSEGEAEAITVEDVLIGEVWLCSGQSNMGVSARENTRYEADMDAADYPRIRLFRVAENVEASEPRDDVKGHWQACTPESARAFSLVGFFFGRDLHQDLGVPVGLICNAASGSPAEAWVARPLLEANPRLAEVVRAWDAALPHYLPVRDGYRKQLAEWREASKRAEAEGKPLPPRPPVPPEKKSVGAAPPWRPSCFYNGILRPLMPYAIRGVIWYQGESNSPRSYLYRELLPLLITSWRREWGQGDFPFLIVQLPSHDPGPTLGPPLSWAELREGQLKATELPNTGLVVTLDLNDEMLLHPKHKREVAQRLALAARGVAYGQDITYSGPIFASMELHGDEAVVRFRHVDGGLVARGGEPTGFEVAGEDLRFVAAEARIDGETVRVRSPKVPRPAAVRYAWANRPAFNLYNREGLPASPFRTYDRPEAAPLVAPASRDE